MFIHLWRASMFWLNIFKVFYCWLIACGKRLKDIWCRYIKRICMLEMGVKWCIFQCGGSLSILSHYPYWWHIHTYDTNHVPGTLSIIGFEINEYFYHIDYFNLYLLWLQFFRMFKEASKSSLQTVKILIRPLRCRLFLTLAGFKSRGGQFLCDMANVWPLAILTI